MNTERATRAVLDLVVRCLDPHQVILFGSAAQGRARVDSDLDLLVIADFREARALRGRELRGLVKSMLIPVDLHFRTPSEVERERNQAYSLTATALEFGKLLYAKR